MEQVNNLTEAVPQMAPWHNPNKLASSSTADLENSDNSNSGKMMN